MTVLPRRSREADRLLRRAQPSRAFDTLMKAAKRSRHAFRLMARRRMQASPHYVTAYAPRTAYNNIPTRIPTLLRNTEVRA